MLKNLINYILILIIITLFGCHENTKLNKNEIEIITDGFVNKLKHWKVIVEADVRNPYKVNCLKLIDKMLLDVKVNNNITQSKDYIYRYAVEKVNNKKIDALSKFEHIKNNLLDFKANNLTMIEEFYFIDQLVKYEYFSGWVCNLSADITKIDVIHSDTILLLENTQYEFPINIVIGKVRSAYEIVSNNLQGSEADKIIIITGESSPKIKKQYISVEIRNRVTNETWNLKDSLNIKVNKIR